MGRNGGGLGQPSEAVRWSAPAVIRLGRNGGGLGQPSEAGAHAEGRYGDAAAMEEGWGSPRRRDSMVSTMRPYEPQWRRAGAALGGGRSSWPPCPPSRRRNGGGLGQPSEEDGRACRECTGEDQPQWRRAGAALGGANVPDWDTASALAAMEEGWGSPRRDSQFSPPRRVSVRRNGGGLGQPSEE